MWRRARLLIFLSMLAGGPLCAQGFAELQDEQALLDTEARELNREAFRARLAHDDEKAKELAKKLDKVQKRRVEVMQALGQLPPSR